MDAPACIDAMKQSKPKTMAATRWLLLICLAAAGVLQSRAQPDSIGTYTLIIPSVSQHFVPPYVLAVLVHDARLKSKLIRYIVRLQVSSA